MGDNSLIEKELKKLSTFEKIITFNNKEKSNIYYLKGLLFYINNEFDKS